ncbi:endospore germination permease [Paenibacillus solisilvae]|uniref:Endospore germination permease n=1 Tax=Paenibacillus solisilvae TaxID=2486751 RepID=A0ABW0W519_9BACL
MMIKSLEKINSRQIGLLMIAVVTASEFLFAPKYASEYAKQDGWISMSLTILPGILMVVLMTALSRRYPGLSIVEVGMKILGKWLGRLFAAFLAYSIFLYIAMNLKSMSTFVSVYALPRTPSLVIVGIFTFVCAIAVLAGIEVQGRCAEFIVPINMLFIALILCFSIPNMKPEQLQPVFENGLLPILKGTIIPSYWVLQGGWLVLGFLLPFLNQQEEGRKVSLLSVGFIVVILVAITAQTLTVIGPFTSESVYPFYSVIRMIGLGETFERVDSIVLFIWLEGLFLKIRAYFYSHSVYV